MRRVWCVYAATSLRAATASVAAASATSAPRATWPQRRMTSTAHDDATAAAGGSSSSSSPTTTTTTQTSQTTSQTTQPTMSGGGDVGDDADTHPDFHPRVVASRLAADEVAAIKRDMVDTIASEAIVVFIKGVPEAPMCAFSKRIIDILEALGLEYTSFDVLAHPVVRAYVKELSAWPTIPQLFVKGEFAGGVDIVLRMAESGQLQMMLDAKGIAHRDQARVTSTTTMTTTATTAAADADKEGTR